MRYQTAPRPVAAPDLSCGSVWLPCEHVFVRDGSCELTCYRCGEVKPAEEFAWRRRRRLQRDSFCRPCRSAYGREHYLANKQRYIDQAAASKRKIRLERTRYLIDFFATHPCVDCGETDPVVLEFDHLDATAKSLRHRRCLGAVHVGKVRR
jgi:hypothetical protein